MLQNIRDNSQGTIAKVIVGLIVVTFALFGVESIVGNWGGDPELAIVNGEEISQVEFAKAVELKRRQVLNQMGERADPALINEEKLQKLVRDELIDQKVMLVDADAKNMAVSEQIINQQILSMPQFQSGGVYSNEVFLNTIRNLGMTTQEFKAWLSKQYLLSQQRNALVGSGFVLESELGRLIKIDRQRRTADVVELSASSFRDQVDLSDEAVKQFYEAHKNEFVFTEKVDVEYVLLDKAEISKTVNVSKEAIEKLYQERKAAFVAEEERDSSHILIETSDAVSDEQALEKLEMIGGKLASGESFEQLAKEYSDDIGSKSDGGRLGYAKKGVFDPKFEEVLFSMEVNTVSEPVKTSFGYHLIKLNGVDKKPYADLGEVYASLEAELKRGDVLKAYLDLSEQLSDISYASADLAGPAKELGLEIKKGEVLKDGSDDLLSNPKVIAAAFSDDVKLEGNNSVLLDIDGDRSIVLRVSKYHPERLYSFEEARELVQQQIVEKNQAVLAKEKGDATVRALSAGETIDLAWQNKVAITRNDNSLPVDVMDKLFSLKEPVGGPVFTGVQSEMGDYFIIKLKQIDYGDVASLNAQELAQASDAIGSQSGLQEFKDFNLALKSAAEIEIN